MTKIVASCPHCFNTLANEYPDFGGRYEVVHHTELLAGFIREGRLAPHAGHEDASPTTTPATSDATTTCSTPRASCSARHRDARGDAAREERSFCCGAGGARMWMEERRARADQRRAVREAAATGADTVAVGLPVLLVMLDDGVRTSGRDLRVGVATLLAESLDDA